MTGTSVAAVAVRRTVRAFSTSGAAPTSVVPVSAALRHHSEVRDDDAGRPVLRLAPARPRGTSPGGLATNSCVGDEVEVHRACRAAGDRRSNACGRPPIETFSTIAFFRLMPTSSRSPSTIRPFVGARFAGRSSVRPCAPPSRRPPRGRAAAPSGSNVTLRGGDVPEEAQVVVARVQRVALVGGGDLRLAARRPRVITATSPSACSAHR